MLDWLRPLVCKFCNLHLDLWSRCKLQTDTLVVWANPHSKAIVAIYNFTCRFQKLHNWSFSMSKVMFVDIFDYILLTEINVNFPTCKKCNLANFYCHNWILKINNKKKIKTITCFDMVYISYIGILYHSSIFSLFYLMSKIFLFWYDFLDLIWI